MTFGFPFFFMLIMIIPILLIGSSLTEDLVIGYVDNSHAFEFPAKTVKSLPPMGPMGPKNYTVVFLPYSDIETARSDISSKKIDAYLVVPENFVETGIIESYSIKKGLNIPEKEISESVVDGLLEDKVDSTILARIRNPVTLKEFSIDEAGEAKDGGIVIFELGLPFISGILLFISIFSASGYLLRGVVEEKESRVIEILLSSVTPVELLTGKILGLGALGLLQISIWISIGTIGTIYALPFVIKPVMLVLALVYFMLGFLMYASIMAGIGAVSGSMQESQQIMVVFTMTAISPLMFMQILITRPDSLGPVFLSMFPLTSPVAMPARAAVADVPVYQIAISILVLSISIYFAVVVSARLFRAGLLMYGKRQRISEIVHYIKTG